MVTLRDRLRDEMTAATRSGQPPCRDTLRLAWSALHEAEETDRNTLLGGGGRG